MGYGNYSHTAHAALLADRAAQPGQEVFTQRSVHPLMDPRGLKVRESRDNADHPNSLPVVFALDVTGSMGDIPELLARQELPTFMKLLTDCGVADPQLMFMAIGDARSDQAALQVGQFESTAELMDQWLTSSYLEGGGGGSGEESYELAFYVLAQHTDTDAWTQRKKRGYLFMTGDEKPYPAVSRHQIEALIGEKLDEDIPIEEVIAAAAETYHLFFLIPDAQRRRNCEARWRELLGDHVICMDAPADACAVAAGIVALTEHAVPNIDALANVMGTHGMPKARIATVVHALESYAELLDPNAPKRASPAVRAAVPGGRSCSDDLGSVAPPAVTRYVSLLGLGFGDCGKGLFTDHLSRTQGVHTVVRFNGGAQAGHNVVLPDGRHHTFSQFAAGSFVPGVETLLASPVVVHPSGLLAEHAALGRVGVTDGLARLRIDARCRVTTPFHQAAGRLREWARGAQAHGSCGVGVGETVRHALAAPDEVLRYGDLSDPRAALDRLEAIRRRLQNEFADHPPMHADWAREGMLLDSPQVAQRWLALSRACVEQVPAVAIDAVARQLSRPGAVLFEGAQGVLLDEMRGFHPHTTWSTISTQAVEAVLRDVGIGAPVQHLGVLRTYLTRHGAGPLPTRDPALDRLPEPHNADTGWQGRFRRGHPDALLLRYALRAVGRLDGLLVSHLDAIGAVGGLRWCDQYRIDDEADTLHELPWLDAPSLAQQTALTHRIAQATPHYDPTPVRTPAQWLERTAAVAQLPVLLGSYGPTTAHVRAIQ